MKKKANRRAFFVCIAICLLYISVAVKIPDKLSFKRISSGHNSLNSMSIASQETSQKPVGVEEVAPVKKITVETREHKKTPAPKIKEDADQTEPSLFISVPLVCFAIKERLIEKKGLVPAGSDSKGNVIWKYPIDILKEKDEEGIRNLSKSIGTKNILGFFKREGIVFKETLSDEDMALGKGYSVDKNKLLAIYKNHVSDDCDVLLPYTLGITGITKLNGVYTFTKTKTEAKNQPARYEQEWVMPNLVNLPARKALEKLVLYTSRIKIIGNGIVVEQSPKPFERVRGDAECVIYGRASK